MTRGDSSLLRRYQYNAILPPCLMGTATVGSLFIVTCCINQSCCRYAGKVKKWDKEEDEEEEELDEGEFSGVSGTLPPKL